METYIYMCIEAIIEAFKPYVRSLINLQFSVFNPLFWIFALLLLLILLKFWSDMKSLFFWSTVIIILLITSNMVNSIEKYIPEDNIGIKSLIRIFSLVIISFVWIYYFFLG